MTESAPLATALAAAIAEAAGSEVQIQELALLPGGASRESWRLDLRVGRGRWKGEHRLVARRELGGHIFAGTLDLACEFRVLRAVHAAGAPAPRPYWFFPDVLGRPTALLERLPGETIGRRVIREPALAEARARLPEQLGAALAAIHRIDLAAAGLAALVPGPGPGQTPIQTQLALVETSLDQLDEPHPALELGLRWLRRREPPPPPRLTLVHGDFRIGNVAVTPTGLAGVLDWEFAHVGDPAEDLAWGSIREWRFGVDQRRFGGVGDLADFVAAYERHGGEPVDRARVAYWEILHNVRWAVGTLNQARRHLGGAEPNLEFASLGRRCAEMELEALRLIRTSEQGSRSIAL